ncbi:stage III sporulation protein AG [Thermanaeromonas toyohensis ToBE]|uniref:Stage III sporulation protein AG n=1 Tax=Thermanaeromonas toyohensis ToBE TaxID=698762 RepID=A0A1W1VYZ5_9FIRM|nr:hypothetical protein [Thermanaeromonas toyohensis]SMB98585.1 stage III sporulation protein AG [Thermanaeromonas toyohensis ToBE]
MALDERLKGWRLPGKPPWYLWVAIGLLVLGSVFLSLGHMLEPKSRNQVPHASNQVLEGQNRESELFTFARALEVELQAILEQVEGAGKVKVSVSLSSTPLKQYATNTRATKRSTEEKDKGGATRVTTETNEDGQLVLARTSAIQGEEPVVVRESKPQIQGVIVVAEGGNDPLVRSRLTEAVQTLWGLAPHQVQVLPMRK